MPAPNELDRSAFLRAPQFWGMYYYMLMETEDLVPSESMEPLFGITHDEMEELSRSHFRVDDPPWPHVRLPMPDGFEISVEFGDDGERYSLRHELTAPLHLGQTGAAFELPVFRWVEIEQIAKSVVQTPARELPPHAALLLLLPAVFLTPDHDRNGVRQALVASWETLGVTPADGIGTLVDRSIDSVSWLAHWRNDPQFGWVNDGPYSRRNPLHSVKPLLAGQVHARSQLLSVHWIRIAGCGTGGDGASCNIA